MAPSKVKFWRRRSSWNTSFLMLDILTELALAMTEFPSLQPILVMDCASIHLAKRVFRRASALGIWILVVLALCTFLVQPCDTHVFSPYKAFLANEYRSAKDANGQVSDEAWVRILIKLATSFLCGRKWADAFHQTSIIGDRKRLTRDVAAVGADPVVRTSPVYPPSPPMVRNLLPRGFATVYNQLVIGKRTAWQTRSAARVGAASKPSSL